MPDIRPKRLLTTLPWVPLAGLAFVAGQVVYVAHRDLPSFTNQDPSGTFGDPSLPPLRIVAIGDSSITAPGVEDLDNTWIRRAAINLSDRYHVEMVSVAVGGSRVCDVIEAQLPKALSLRPDIAILSVGGNDALREPRLHLYEQGLDHLVAALHRGAGAVVVQGVGDLGLVPRLPIPLSQIARHRARRVDAAITRIADRYPRAVKIQVAAATEAMRSGGPELFTGDLFHASDLGHLVFVEELMPALDEALAMLPPPPHPGR